MRTQGWRRPLQYFLPNTVRGGATARRPTAGGNTAGGNTGENTGSHSRCGNTVAGNRPARSHLRAVVSGGKQLTSLNLQYCYNITDAAVEAVASGCPQLTLLNLGECNDMSHITEAAVQAVASVCPHLTVQFVCSHAVDEVLGAC